MKNLTPQEAERFASRYTKVSECWVWNGALDKDGYGTFFLRGASRRAHRVAWFAVHGPIEDGFVVNHTCRNRACVNPQHLQCITEADNALKDSASLAYLNSQKTVCKNGHPFDKVVTWAGKTQRVCSICDAERRREAKRKRHQEAKAALKV